MSFGIKTYFIVPLLLLGIFFMNIPKVAAIGFSDVASWSSYTPSSHGIATSTFHFPDKSIFDGRYLYFIPHGTSLLQPTGEVLRYDTLLPYSASTSWQSFDVSSIDSRAKGFWGGVFDGRYIYFVADYNGIGGGYGDTFARFDTTQSFSNAASWKAYSPGSNGVGTHAAGYVGGAYDGKYVYFAPLRSNIAVHGEVMRLDTTTNFDEATSWSAYTPHDDGVGVYGKGFTGVVFDGTYMYFVPNTPDGGSVHGEVLRYDTRKPYTVASSWKTFDPSSNGLPSSLRGFQEGIFDGTYLYFVPYANGTQFGQIMRFNTTKAFTDISSWEYFDMTTVNGGAIGYIGGHFDGRYIYLSQLYNGGYAGLMARYDTLAPFTSASSWNFFSPADNGVGNNARGFEGIGSDGKYLYFSPVVNGEILRYNLQSTAALSLSTKNIAQENTSYTFTFTPSGSLPNDARFDISFPSAYTSSFAALTANDIEVTGTSITGKTVSFLPEKNLLRVVIHTSAPTNGPITISIGDGVSNGLHDLTNPNAAGSYAIGIDLYPGGERLYEQKIVYAEIPNGIPVQASVSEALLISLDSNALRFSVSPVTTGVDNTQHTTINVATNARNGYKIYGSLRDAQGNARLSNATNSIPGGVGDNSFGFEVINLAFDTMHTVTPDSFFSSIQTVLNSHSSDVELLSPTNGQDHTIYYSLQADFATAAGAYAGSIVYTAVGNF